MPQLLKKAGEVGLLGGGFRKNMAARDWTKFPRRCWRKNLSVYASFAVTHGGHSGIGTMPIVYFGTEEQKKKYLPSIATGEIISCYCLSEPQAGSDALAARTRAVLSPDGKNWILNGQKMWITNGGFADFFVVFAKVDGEKFSCFLVERGAPGFSSGAEEKKMGIHGSSTVPLFFENTPRAERKSAARNRARAHCRVQHAECGTLSAWARIAWAARRKCWKLRRNTRRSAWRSARQLAKFGLIEAKLAEMAIRIYAVESMIYRSAGHD